MITMNRLRKGDRELTDEDEDIEYGYSENEKRALIDRQDNEDDDIDLFSANPYEVRQRSSRSKLSTQTERHELSDITKTKRQRDLISEPIVEYTYYDIKPGDTLHGICLRYACPLAQVRRINGFMNDQEFYGLRKIKLPLGKLGLLGDVLTSQQISPSKSLNQEAYNRNKIVISPGSALSITTHHNAKFKPLLSPGYSSDRIDELNKFTKNGMTDSGEHILSHMKTPHSHSFSSLRDFTDAGISQELTIPDRHRDSPDPIHVDTRQLKEHSFIRAHFDARDQTVVDNIPSTTDHDNVDKVFENLDYHVEKAKVAAESYGKRAIEIVDRIDVNSPATTLVNSQRISKIPELFICGENFGLSYKKLLLFIIVVCLFVPLIYINQATIVTN